MNGKIYKYFNKKKYEEEGIEKYYIGQTTRTIKQRAGKDGCRYIKDNPHNKFSNAIKKWGWDAFECEILEENIQTNEELNELEIKYINEYDSYNNGYNSTLGGDGVSGFQLSEHRKQKMNESRIKKVYCPELNMTFNGVREASRYVGLTSSNNISQVCKGNRHFAGSYNINGIETKLSWKYVNPDDNNTIKIKKGKFSEEYKKKISKSVPKQKVYCPELNMTFNSTKDAADYTNMKNKSNISQVCRGKRSYAGSYIINGVKTKLTWKYID